jgi:hypothetical protein
MAFRLATDEAKRGMAIEERRNQPEDAALTGFAEAAPWEREATRLRDGETRISALRSPVGRKELARLRGAICRSW